LALFTDAFSYDAVNRVIAATDSGGWSRSFGYDQYGNMWTPASSGVPVNGTTPTTNIFNPANNRISGRTYDTAGNQTVVGSYSVAYDAENRQAVAYDNVTQGQATYVYDGDGRRVQKVISGGPTTTYVYDALGQLVAEYSSAAPPTAPCYTCYLSYDHLGTARLITDGAANVIARHDYLPFGEEIPGASANRTSQWGSGTDNINQKFTGQERDSETGLDFFQARYMSAAQGRFNSPDPMNAGADLTNPQSWNGYSYVWNNPLNAVDPSGMDIWFPGPCEDPEDPECGGEPPTPPPCLSFDCGGGGNGGGQRGSGQGGNQTAPSYPLPPGSFPGGETLGLPPGIRIPGPFGVSVPNPFETPLCPTPAPCISSPSVWAQIGEAVSSPWVLVCRLSA
jgi:RHS repeat-associated protein